jgi:uncharacterized protein (UPF0305 family)
MDQEMKEYLDRKLLSLATKDDVEKLRQETKANFHQLKEEDKTNIMEWRRETQTVIDLSNQVLTSSLQQIKEMEGLREQIKKMESLKEQMKQTEGLKEEIRQMAEKITALDGKTIEGFAKLKETQVPMAAVSYADLEKKIKELEAKVKTLEKMVLP